MCSNAVTYCDIKRSETYVHKWRTEYVHTVCMSSNILYVTEIQKNVTEMLFPWKKIKVI